MAALFACAFSSGYCFYDIFVCILEIKFTAFECRDYIFHHAVGVFGAILVLITGQFLVLLSVANLVSESSNFLMNIRWRLLKHKMTESPMFFATSVVFMIVFFCSRVIFMLMVTFRIFEINYTVPVHKQHPAIYLAMIIAEICQVLLYALQVWWFYVIFMNFVKTITGGFKIAKTDKDR